MKKGLAILLDNGHGKETPGKRSPRWKDGSQLFEWEFNRSIVSRLITLLAENYIPFEIVTPEDTDIPLEERVRRANKFCCKYGKNNCLLVSIHANAGGGSGWEAWTSIGNTDSDTYATLFYEEARKYFAGWKIRQDTSDGDPDKENNFYILKHTLCPAVLTENFFMDTEKDCRFLMSREGRDKIANMHLSAISKCVELHKKNE